MMTIKAQGRSRLYPGTAVLTLAVLTVLLILVSGSEASRPLTRRPLDILMKWDRQQKSSHDEEHQEPAAPTDVQERGPNIRRVLGEVVNTREDPSDCGFGNLHECAPSANYQFPTFESKKEVPNGPNPLHN